MTDLSIRALLDLSAGHLSRETYRDLNSYEGVCAYRISYGWLMYVPEEDEAQSDIDGDWPAELRAVVNLARVSGCTYIQFDRDAPPTELLPAFDW